jgi:Sigma-54 interaction domain
MSLRVHSDHHADSPDNARLLIEHQTRVDVGPPLSTALPSDNPRPAASNASFEGGLPMDTEGMSQRRGTLALDSVEDEDVAARSDAKLLITASAPLLVEALARRIHAAGVRAALPFVQTWACDFPIDRQMLGATCSSLLDTATGGSVLISDVEEMPRIVQDTLMELLADLELARAPLPLVRLIAGTTVSLLDRVEAGTFSDRLFYRLNTIHVLAESGNRPVESA